MLKSQRHEAIVNLTNSLHTVTVKDLADTLGISEMTVRRDLVELDSAGKIERVHGGAQSLLRTHHPVLGREFSHNEKRLLNADLKKQVAQAAVNLIHEGDTIFIGTGTTAELMVPLIPNMRLRIVTNSLAVFGLIENKPEFELYLVGGLYRPATMSFVGPVAEAMISSIGFSKVFIGTNGVADNNIYTSGIEPGSVQAAAYEAAEQRYLLADSSKFGRRDFYSFYKLNKLDAVITEPGISPELKSEIQQRCEVITI